MDETTQRLLDESDLRDVIHRYAFGLDRQDWTLWRSVFADHVVMDMSDYQPDPPPRSVRADSVVRSTEVLFAGLEGSQHLMGSHRFEIAGDTAVITAHMRAEHWLNSGQGDDRYTMYGTYTDECIRTSNGWKLTKVTLRLIREEGNRHLMRLAARRGKAIFSDRGPSGT
jgi:SnoaL-like domain